MFISGRHFEKCWFWESDVWWGLFINVLGRHSGLGWGHFEGHDFKYLNLFVYTTRSSDRIRGRLAADARPRCSSSPHYLSFIISKEKVTSASHLFIRPNRSTSIFFCKLCENMIIMSLISCHLIQYILIIFLYPTCIILFFGICIF